MRPGFEPGTSRLPVLSVTAEPLVGPEPDETETDLNIKFQSSGMGRRCRLSLVELGKTDAFKTCEKTNREIDNLLN